MKKNFGVMVLLLLVAAGAAGSAAKPQGMFYIVGMGSAPDLVTLRALETIRQSDILIVESEYEKTIWGKYIEGKEIWYCPHDFRVFYGMDPESAKNEKISSWLGSSKRVAQRLTSNTSPV